MKEKIEIEQSWWHIEDQRNPVESRSIREVIDIYAKNKDLELDLENINNIYEIRVKGRNRNTELAFINCSSSNDKNELHINLGDLKGWPIIKGYSGFDSHAPRHVRLEISYKQNSEFKGIFKFNRENYRIKKDINSYIKEYHELLGLNQPKEAISKLKEGIELDPIYTVKKLNKMEISEAFNNGLKCHKKKNLNEAIESYKEVITNVLDINLEYLLEQFNYNYRLNKEKEEILRSSIINLDDFDELNLKEIEFKSYDKIFYIKDNFVKIIVKSIKNFRFFQGYVGSFEIDWFIQPEFSITLPLGMEMNNDGNKLKLFFKRGSDFQELKFDKPSISKKDGKRVYTYIINSESYKKILETPDNSNVGFKALYEVNNEIKFFTVPLFSLVLIVYSFIEIGYIINMYLSHNYSNLSLINNPTFVIVSLSFLGLYLTFRKDDYEIPGNKIVIASIILSFVAIIILLCSYPYFLDLNSTQNITQNISFS